MSYKPTTDEPVDRSCPTPESVIAQYLQANDRRIPKGFPSDPFQAARFWMAHQIQPDAFTEAATPPVTKGGNWGTPYHDRLLYTLKKFLKLKAVHQVYVIEQIERGIPWGGDEIDLYIQFVEESDKMAQNKSQYIEEGFKKMHRALKGMVV